jgi:hypothetical protein
MFVTYTYFQATWHHTPEGVAMARAANFVRGSTLDIKIKGREKESADPLIVCMGGVIGSLYMPRSRACIISNESNAACSINIIPVLAECGRSTLDIRESKCFFRGLETFRGMM